MTPDAPRRTDDARVLEVLESRYEAATTAMSEPNARSQDLWKRYRREKYGDEIKARSQYVTGDVAGTVDWTLTDLMRLFLSGDIIAGYQPQVPGEEAARHAAQEEDYTNAVFLRDNDGYQNLRDYLLNGLVGLRGYAAVYWEDPEPGDTISMTGVGMDVVERVLSDPAAEVVPESVVARTTVQDGQGVTTFDFDYARMDYSGCIRIEVPDPDDVLIAKGFDTEDEADYVALRREVSRSELRRMFPDKGEVIDRLRHGEESDRPLERDDPTSEPGELERANETFQLLDEYVRLDLDGDGVAELNNFKRVGTTMLESGPVDMQPIAGWSSRPAPGKMFGSSLAESAEQSQRLRTTMVRTAIDSARMATTPRWIANHRHVDINSLMDMSYGAVVRTHDSAPNGPLSQLVQPVTMPDVSESALRLAEAEEREREFVTGINRQSQGLDPDSLTDTYSGMALLQNSASARKELIAREAARGLEAVFRKIGKLIRRHHDFKREYKGRTGFMVVEPQRWLDECAIDVDIGVGTGSRESAMGRLQMIAEAQEKIVSAGLPIVQPQNIYELAVKQVEALGMRDATKFFTDPSTLPPESPQADPEAEKAKADMQMQEARLAADMKAQAAKAEQDMRIADAKAQGEMEIQRFKADSERRLAEQRAADEMELARLTASIEAAQAQVALPARRPGGDLSK